MNAYLLDTHVLAWAVTAPQHLSPPAEAVLLDPTSRLLVSSVVPWEMAIKHHANRWPEAEVLLQQFDDILERLGATHLDQPRFEIRRPGRVTRPMVNTMAATGRNHSVRPSVPSV